MTNEQYYELIKPYEDASRVLSTRLEILNHSLYGDRSAAGPIPVSYTHLTLPTIA